jgi:archaellum component FlaC
MINEVTIQNEQRLQAIENQIDSLTSEIINQGQNIGGLQTAVERHGHRLGDGQGGFFARTNWN